MTTLKVTLVEDDDSDDKPHATTAASNNVIVDDDNLPIVVDDSAMGTGHLPYSASRGVQLVLQPTELSTLGWWAAKLIQASWAVLELDGANTGKINGKFADRCFLAERWVSRNWSDFDVCWRRTR